MEYKLLGRGLSPHVCTMSSTVGSWSTSGVATTAVKCLNHLALWPTGTREGFCLLILLHVMVDSTRLIRKAKCGQQWGRLEKTCGLYCNRKEDRAQCSCCAWETSFSLVHSSSGLFLCSSIITAPFPHNAVMLPHCFYFKSLGLDLVTQGFGISPTCWNVAPWKRRVAAAAVPGVPLLALSIGGDPGSYPRTVTCQNSSVSVCVRAAGSNSLCISLLPTTTFRVGIAQEITPGSWGLQSPHSSLSGM